MTSMHANVHAHNNLSCASTDVLTEGKKSCTLSWIVARNTLSSWSSWQERHNLHKNEWHVFRHRLNERCCCWRRVEMLTTEYEADNMVEAGIAGTGADKGDGEMCRVAFFIHCVAFSRLHLASRRHVWYGGRHPPNLRKRRNIKRVKLEKKER